MMLLMQQGNSSSRMNSRGLFKFMSKPLEIVPRKSSTPSPWVDFQGKGELQDIVVAMLQWRGAMAAPHPTCTPAIDSWMDVEWMLNEHDLANEHDTYQFSLFFRVFGSIDCLST